MLIKYILPVISLLYAPTITPMEQKRLTSVENEDNYAPVAKRRGPAPAQPDKLRKTRMPTKQEQEEAFAHLLASAPDKYKRREIIKHKNYYGSFTIIESEKSHLYNILNYNSLDPKLSATHTYSSIHEAAQAGDAIALKRYLATNKSLVTQQDENGDTPLHHACDYQHDEVIRILCENGANYKTPNNEGLTPWGIASENGKYQDNAICHRMFFCAQAAANRLQQATA